MLKAKNEKYHNSRYIKGLYSINLNVALLKPGTKTMCIWARVGRYKVTKCGQILILKKKLDIHSRYNVTEMHFKRGKLIYIEAFQLVSTMRNGKKLGCKFLPIKNMSRFRIFDLTTEENKQILINADSLIRFDDPRGIKWVG